MSDSSSGIGALVKLTSWLECRLDCELLSIGRSAEDSEESCTAIICGKHLIYAIVWDTNTVALLAQTLDSIELPEVLLSMDDNLNGWKNHKFSAACIGTQ